LGGSSRWGEDMLVAVLAWSEDIWVAVSDGSKDISVAIYKHEASEKMRAALVFMLTYCAIWTFSFHGAES
jgi:hypothetical protein